MIVSFKNDIIGQSSTSFASAAKVMHGEKASAHIATTTLYPGNQQYSVTAISDSSGNVSERYAYTAYGHPTFLNASGEVQTSSAASNGYTYTGREWDAALGLYHFRARWISGLTGRFLRRDPIGYLGSRYNLAYFLGDRPTKLIDPLGLMWTIAGFVRHYYFGFGAPITLEQTGLEDYYWNLPMIQTGLNDLETSLLGGIGGQLSQIKCPGGGFFSFHFHDAYPVDFGLETSGLYVLGRGLLQIKANCVGGKVCTSCCSFTTVHCEISVFQRDYFTDPLDFDDWIGTPYDLPYSVPYEIYTSIDGQYSNSTLQCTNGYSATWGSGFDYDFEWTNPLFL